MTGIRRPDDEDPDLGAPPPPGGAGIGEGDLEQWLGELRVDAAGRERTRRRSLVDAATQEATTIDTMTDLAERREPVVVDLVDDRKVVGVIRLVGTDVVVLRDGRTDHIVPLSAVASIHLRPERTMPSGGYRNASGLPALAPRGDRPVGGLDLVRLLAGVAESAPTVRVQRRGVREAVTGVLAAVGRDLLVVHVAPAGPTYVPLWSLAEVSLTGSG